jgi:hypothetical protein
MKPSPAPASSTPQAMIPSIIDSVIIQASVEALGAHFLNFTLLDMSDLTTLAGVIAPATAPAAALPLTAVMISRQNTRSRGLGALEDVDAPRTTGRKKADNAGLFQKMNSFKPAVISTDHLKVGGIQKKGAAQVVAPALTSRNGHDAEGRKLRSGTTHPVLTGSDQSHVNHDPVFPSATAAAPEPVHDEQDTTNLQGVNVFVLFCCCFFFGGGGGGRERGGEFGYVSNIIRCCCKT